MKNSLREEGLWNYHMAYGLAIRSEFPLPELSTPTIASGGEPTICDVTVKFGKVPEQIEGGQWIQPYFQHGETSSLIKIRNKCRILLRNSNEIIVEVFKDVPLSDVRGFILGSALGALLHQRNILPLHISAIDAPFGSFAITGQSGAGKSTLSMFIHQLTGWPIICDDVAIAQYRQGGMTLVSGVNRVKIWEDTIDALALDSSRLVRDVTRFNKFHFTESGLFSNSKQKLKMLFVIEDGPGFNATRLLGAEKFRAVMNSIYRPEYVSLYWELRDVIQACASIAQTIEVIQISRDKATRTPKDSAELILREINTVVG